MSLFVKSLIATGFIIFGFLAVWSMFTLMGRTETKLGKTALRRIHKIFGFIFLILLLVLSYYCAILVRAGGDNLPIRGVIHSVLALGLFIVLILKIAIVRFYNQFMRFVPVMGIIVFVLAFLVYATSAGFYFLMQARSKPATPPEMTTSLSILEQQGKDIFEEHCAFCHHADRLDSKLGPGLKGILKAETLPASGRPATRENVRDQLVKPVGGMPSFKTTLSEEDLGALLVYLGTL